MAAAPTTPPEDAVEMLDCLAAAGTPQDRALLDELQRRPPSPLRDRAVELGVRSRARKAVMAAAPRTHRARTTAGRGWRAARGG